MYLVQRIMFAVVVLCIILAPTAASAQLSNFDGYWSGTARGQVSTGQTENLKCTSNNAAHGSGLRITLRCANASGVSLQIKASLTETGGRLGGTWEERTYNVNGTVSGSVSGNTLSATIASPNFVAHVRVTRNGNSLSISLVPSQGTGSIQVAMSR